MDFRKNHMDLCDMEVTINDQTFICHSFLLCTKSTYLKNCVVGCNKKELPYRIDLSEVPGGVKAFELVMDFCYDFTTVLTATNVLMVLAAADFLQFSEDMMENNLIMQCEKFIELKGATNMESILKILSSMEVGVHGNRYNLYETKLVKNLAEQALCFQHICCGKGAEVVKLMLELNMMEPSLLNGILHEFEKKEVYFIESLWWVEKPDDWGSMAKCRSENTDSIFLHLAKSFDRSIHHGNVQASNVDTKLLMLLLPHLFPMCSTKSKELIMGCMISNIASVDVEDILCLSPKLILDIIAPIFSSSTNAPISRAEVHHAAHLIDGYLQIGVERQLWNLDFQDNFKKLIECVPQNVRSCHDSLYNAVVSFARSISHEAASSFWDIIDISKLSESSVENAIEVFLPDHAGFLKGLIQRVHDNQKILKRKLASYEDVGTIKRRMYANPAHERHYIASFSIFIRSPSGQLFSVVATTDTTIHSIKKSVIKKGGMQHVKSWWLVYGMKELLDHETLADRDVEKDSTLCIRFARPGIQSQ